MLTRLRHSFLLAGGVSVALIMGSVAIAGSAHQTGDTEMDHSNHATMDHSDHTTMDHSNHVVGLDETTVERRLASYDIPNLTLLNQRAETVSLAELMATDQPVLLNFIFTSCTAICPALSATFSNVQNRLGKDSERIRMVSISIDPEYDRPDQLSAYAKRFRAGPQWHFLTGSLDDSITVQKAFDADRGDKMNHAAVTFLRGKRDSQWLRFEGFAGADELVAELRELL